MKYTILAGRTVFHMRDDTWVLKDERDIDRKCREGAFQVQSTVRMEAHGKRMAHMGNRVEHDNVIVTDEGQNLTGNISFTT